MSRGWGTMFFNRDGADYIPAIPDTRNSPQHLVLPDESTAHRQRMETRFDDEKGEFQIDLFYCEPDKERESINDAIARARRRGTINLMVISIASEVFAQPEVYHFFTREKFERDISREQHSGGMIVLTRRLSPPA